MWISFTFSQRLASSPSAPSGALISGGNGTFAAKFQALEKAGVTTVKSPADLGKTLAPSGQKHPDKRQWSNPVFVVGPEAGKHCWQLRVEQGAARDSLYSGHSDAQFNSGRPHSRLVEYLPEVVRGTAFPLA